ncbi:MAG: hydrogenase nickel incorporation protein HypB [Oscillospiraceae bacterium]|nr:hydrogenase nickel incorporation protein HypB [Oscillospiraceae bacterium]
MDYRIIDVKEQVLEENDRIAAETRAALARSGAYLVNLMGSPGAGKTSVLLRLLALLGREYRVGVLEADVDSDVDAAAVAAAGAKVVQLHTGGLCHMDAAMTRQGLDALGAELLDLVILENVGNLVCPAEFDVGADLRMMILSVPEGDDKPLKYPLMFQVSDVMLVNKIDAAPVFDFDFEAAKARALALNPNIAIFPISAKTGEGFEALAAYLRERLASDKHVWGGAHDAPSQPNSQENGPSKASAPTTDRGCGN